MSNPSGPENRKLAEDRADRAAEEAGRVQRAGVFAAELAQAARDVERARRLRPQIEATKQRGRDGEDVGDRLRELGREHHRITGAGGGA